MVLSDLYISFCSPEEKGPLIVIITLTALLLCVIVVDMVRKGLLKTARPYDAIPEIKALWGSPTTPSFPSGHAASSFAAAASLSRHSNQIRAYIWILAFLISASRLYLIFHYPSDIAAGAFIGVLLGISVPKLFRR